MKVVFQGPRKVIVTMTPGQLRSLMAALDSVSSVGEELGSGVYSDIPIVENALARAIYKAEFTKGAKNEEV